MAIRFLSGERGRRSLCMTLLFLLEVFAFSATVMAEEDLCFRYKAELNNVRKELRYRPWNPPPALVAQRRDLAEKVREHCSRSPSAAARRGRPNLYAPGEYETTAQTPVRSGPGRHFDEITTLSRGAKVTVDGSEGRWLRVVSKRGRPPGYISAFAARPLDSAQSTESARSSSPPPVSQPEERQAESRTEPPVSVPSASDGIREKVIQTFQGRPAAVEHILVETDEAQAVSLSRSGGPGAWCRGGKYVRVALRSTREGVSLKQNYPALVRSMLEKLKPVVERGCPGAESIDINLDEKTRGYFSTARKQADGWVIAELREEVSAPASAIPAPSGDHVKDCDALAAHPADPQRNGAQGREDENIHAEKAIAACKAAVEQDPQNARLLFQLGRSYWVDERFEEAIEAFLVAGEQGHGGALAYLGDATLYGVADLDPDPEEAKNLYNRAAAAGFMPASSLSGEIVAGVEVAPEQEPEQEEQQEAGGEPQYHHPKTIAALAGGDVKFDGKLSQKGQAIYMIALLAGVSHQCPSIIPSPFNSIDLSFHLGKWMIQRFGWEGALVFNAEIENGAFESTNQEGVDDGYAFVYGKDCQSRETGRFVGTIAGYFN